MRYFSHRPFAFWFTTSLAGVGLLVAAFFVGVNTHADDGGVTTPPVAQTITTAERSRILAQYGRLAAAATTSDASSEAGALADESEGCAALGNSTCASIVREATELSSWLSVQSPAYFEPGDEVYEEYFLKRRNVSSYINELIARP